MDVDVMRPTLTEEKVHEARPRRKLPTSKRMRRLLVYLLLILHSPWETDVSVYSRVATYVEDKV